MSGTIRSLQAALGRELATADRLSVATLNDLPLHLVREARELVRGSSRVAAVAYLQFYVEKSELDAAAGFIDDVLLDGSTAASDWGKRDVICIPNCHAPGWVGRSADELVSTVADVEGEHWFRVTPTVDNWDWSGVAGAPGVIVRAAPYWYSAPELAECADLDPSHDVVEPLDDLRVATHRWIASRIAWTLRGVDDTDRASIADIAALLRVTPEQLGVAARCAIAALAELGWTVSPANGLVPGFAGPDARYVWA